MLKKQNYILILWYKRCEQTANGSSKLYSRHGLSFPYSPPQFFCNQEWHHWDNWSQLLYCNTGLTWMHMWTMWSCRSELLSFLSTQEFGIPRETLSVLLHSQPGSGWGAVCELTFYMWSEKNLTSFPDPKWGMQIIILHWAEQEAKLKIFTAPGRLTGSWSQRLSLRLYNALSILDTELPVFTIWKCATGKYFLKGGLQGPLFYGI